VRVLLDGIRPAGTHVVAFDGSRLPSGVYFYELVAGKARAVRKCLLLQ